MLFSSADLVHLPIGDHRVHVQIRRHQRPDLVLVQQTQGYRLRAAAVVGVQRRPAHAVGDGQPPAGPDQPRQRPDQPRRIGKVREGVIDHHHVIGPAVPHGGAVLHIAAYHRDLRPGGLFRRPRRHLRRQVDSRYPRRAALYIVAEQHTGAAGHVQHRAALAYPGVIQYPGDDRLIPHHARVPVRCQPVKERLYIPLVDHAAALS